MKKSVNITLSVLGYIIFIALWLFIGFYGLLIFGFDRGMIHIAIKVIFIVLALAIIVSPIYIKVSHPKRICISIIVTIIFVLVWMVTNFGIESYYSVFTPEKWQEHRYLRYKMVESLESKHTVIGMTGEEIVELLGEPNEIKPMYPESYDLREDFCYYEYTVSAGWGFNYTNYRITFKGGTATETDYVQIHN